MWKRMVTPILAVCLCCSLFVGPAFAADTESSKGVGISFEQTADNVFFDFQVDTATYDRVYYNTSVRDGETLVKVVFHSEENPSDQKFVRLHLAQAILPADTSASTTEEGAKLTFSKATPGQRWTNVVNFASDEALQGTIPVNVAGNMVDITASEFEDLSNAIAKSLDRIEGVQYTSADVDLIAQQFGDAFDKSTPYCVAPSFCVCKLPFVFDGTKCVSGDLWKNFQSKVVSQSAVQVQVEEGKPLRTLGDQELLELEDETFNVIFDTYQKRAAKQQMWPYMLYAQSLKRSNVLVVGGGMTQFEPLVMVNSGVNVTVVDSNLNNLKLLNRIADSSQINKNLLHLVYVPNLEGLDELKTEYDVILALDSLTKAPTELLEDVYFVLLSKLRLGGRWIQLAPSKSRYMSEGSPSYKDFAQIYNRHLGVPEETVWYEWLDIPKLMKILAPTKSRFQIIFDGELGSNPVQFPDNFQLIDLLYLGRTQ
ncbi:hypothetical protein HOP50_10g59500 [Chloropicon primus]|uniref:S-adenosyl-L-methionine-dependent methyltransferase n=1 Tax=Chloropicon primus TaxID=1764295 RepID=A0A5B8MST6_9CHLO|nr:hypothetical protein A3770_10p59290 [Chloropicon primus]UPR02623.1 hypothetical protein HOP50_10g59500 [Chloropicon primus]|eukprot:QDZ23411.1 hypothetical protein A3770_10p59290 [Chloropicon primus]